MRKSVVLYLLEGPAKGHITESEAEDLAGFEPMTSRVQYHAVQQTYWIRPLKISSH